MGLKVNNEYFVRNSRGDSDILMFEYLFLKKRVVIVSMSGYHRHLKS